MVGGCPGEKGLLQRNVPSKWRCGEGYGESHVFPSSEWAAWLGASESRDFKTDKTGLEDGPGSHPHLSFRTQTLRGTETPSLHCSTPWPAPGATAAPSSQVSAWVQAQLRWAPSYKSFQKLLSQWDWGSPPSRTPAQFVMLGGPQAPSPSAVPSHLVCRWRSLLPPHTCSRCPLNLSSVRVISLTSNIYRDALMSEKQTDQACWRCHGEGP